MNIRSRFCWLLGHTYDVIQPSVLWRDEFGFACGGYYAVCSTCGATVRNPDESLPKLMPEWHK